jgi:hypothetical protein
MLQHDRMSWDLTVLRAPPGTALGAKLSEDDLEACLPLGPRAEALARVEAACQDTFTALDLDMSDPPYLVLERCVRVSEQVDVVAERPRGAVAAENYLVRPQSQTSWVSAPLARRSSPSRSLGAGCAAPATMC